MGPLEILQHIDAGFSEMMERGLGKNGLLFPINPGQIEDAALKEMCQRFSAVFDMINDAYRYARQLAQGDLKAEASRGNPFAMPIKALQASLCHLTWQTHRVADGDLNQQVHFLGEFSASFNRMIGALREKEILEQRLKTITDVIGDGILFVDTEGKINFSNPEAHRLLEYSFDEIAGTFIHKSIHRQRPDGTDILPNENPLFTAIASGQNFNHENSVFTCKSGLLMPVMIVCRPVVKKSGMEGAIIAFRDISEQKRHLQSLETLNDFLKKVATTDSLTGIDNRMAFDKTATIEIERARRYDSPLSLIMFDIDKFKTINDTYGHFKGDDVLKRVVGLVSANIRQTDVFARWGGEEFVVLSPGLATDAALEFAEKLRGMIELNDFSVPREITASFGVTGFRVGDDIGALIRKADGALYRAKENGRNQVMPSEA